MGAYACTKNLTMGKNLLFERESVKTTITPLFSCIVSNFMALLAHLYAQTFITREICLLKKTLLESLGVYCSILPLEIMQNIAHTFMLVLLCF